LEHGKSPFLDQCLQGIGHLRVKRLKTFRASVFKEEAPNCKVCPTRGGIREDALPINQPYIHAL